MKKIRIFIDKIIAYLFIGLIKIYQYTISPDKGIFSPVLKGKICSHEPHCSEYGIRTLKRYWFFNGIGKVTDRVLHCRASMQKIYDPEHYRIVFMCSAQIGVPFLSQLKKDKRFEITGVVSQADKPVGRGLKMQENIIKSTAKELFSEKGKQIKKVLVIHGFASNPNDIRFPWLKNIAEEKNIEIKIPKLPSFKSNTIEDQIEFLTKNYGNRIDKNTMIITHSLWGILAKHFLIKTNKKIAKLIDIAPAYQGRDYESMKKKDSLYAKSAEYLNIYVNKHPIDHNKIAELVNVHHIYISKDDPIIEHAITHKYHDSNYPKATIIHLEDKEHFLKNTELPEILAEFQTDFSDFIQTPQRINPEKSVEGKIFFEWLKEKNPDYLVVIAYGKILPQSILDVPHFGPINVHGSLLPKYRGASPLQSVFLNKEEKTWITIMQMDAWMDTGDIIDECSFKIPFHRTSKELIKALEKEGPEFLTTTLRNFGKKLIKAKAQNEKEATYCQKIEKADGKIDPFKDSLDEIYSKYRAYVLRPKIRFELQGKIVIIEEIELNEPSRGENKHQPLIHWKQLNACVKNILIKPEGKKAMNRENFNNWYLK